MLTVNTLSKWFNRDVALENISFSINAHEIVGLVGPNGSGKTTLLNILMGMLKPTSGYFITDPGIKIGMSVSRKGFFDDMSVYQNLKLYARLLNVGKKILDELMDHFMIDYGDSRFGTLSAGMKQRVSLILPFIDKYDLILLDEPSNHLDIDSLLALRNLILDRNKTGTAFLIASHAFSDLEKVCTRMLFLKNGVVRKDCPTTQLIGHYGSLEGAYINLD